MSFWNFVGFLALNTAKLLLYKAVDFCVDWAISIYSSDSYWHKLLKTISREIFKELLYKAVDFCIDWVIKVFFGK